MLPHETESEGTSKSGLSISISITNPNDLLAADDLKMIPPIPSSPTDCMLSPCSQRLYGFGKKQKVPLRKMITKGLVPQPSQLSHQLVDNTNTVKYCIQNDVKVTPLILGENEKLILASSSANRKIILDLMGWTYTQMSPDIDEKAIRSPDPHELPLLVAKGKAAAIVNRLRDEGYTDSAVILTADQVVLFKGEVREKPVTVEEATKFLSSYSNEYVSTVSAVVGTHFPSGRQKGEVEVASLKFGEITSDIVDRVVAKGEIFSSAGGFRVEDIDLNPLIDTLEGSIDSIYGMPVGVTLKIIAEVASLSQPIIDPEILSTPGKDTKDTND